ncbi:MAG: hypothetical protein KJ597_00535 [Nanoarchaeota archaeon]|nr:hypothetical protein [Nanoarchaeota archaeon]MBU1622039.1 hypothetical protein [Nanoarchaeota archaeon]
MTECGLTNLAVCLPEKFFEYIASLLNGAVEPLLELTRYLLTEPVSISTFHPLWAVIIYVISLFYGLFFMFAGFNLMISGYDAAKRERAKHWLRNIVLMIFFIQASFLMYSLMIELSSLLTTGIIDIIDPNFFLMTADSMTNFSLQITLLFPYLTMLLLTVLMLALRYLIVAIGVVFVPFAFLFYFIPPLQSYGKLILNVLTVIIFVPFFSGIILFGTSALMSIPMFADYKIVLSLVGFGSVSGLLLFLVAFALLKAVFSVKNSVTMSQFRSSYNYLASKSSVPADKGQTKLNNY